MPPPRLKSPIFAIQGQNTPRTVFHYYPRRCTKVLGQNSPFESWRADRKFIHIATNRRGRQAGTLGTRRTVAQCSGRSPPAAPRHSFPRVPERTASAERATSPGRCVYRSNPAAKPSCLYSATGFGDITTGAVRADCDEVTPCPSKCRSTSRGASTRRQKAFQVLKAIVSARRRQPARQCSLDVQQCAARPRRRRQRS